MRKRGNRGFSLIELMTVVLVVIVLVGILIPVVIKARERSKQSRCAGNLKQIGLALIMYANDFTAYFPNVPKSTNFGPLNIQKLTERNTNLFACPSASSAYTSVNFSNYKYVGSGLKDDNATPFTVSLGYDCSGNHPTNRWMNLLFIDGHVDGAEPGKLPNRWKND